MKLHFNERKKQLRLYTGRTVLGTNVEKGITLPSSFHDKKVVLWLTENSNANTIKASISNYSRTITMNKSPFSCVRDTSLKLI